MVSLLYVFLPSLCFISTNSYTLALKTTLQPSTYIPIRTLFYANESTPDGLYGYVNDSLNGPHGHELITYFMFGRKKTAHWVIHLARFPTRSDNVIKGGTESHMVLKEDLKKPPTLVHKNPLFDAHAVYKRSVDNSLTFQDVEETYERNKMEKTDERIKTEETDERGKTEETDETNETEEIDETNKTEETDERSKTEETDERSKTEETEETSSSSETSDDLSTDNKRIVDDNNISAKVGEEAFTTHDSKSIRFSLQGFEEHFKEKVKKTLEFVKSFYKDWVKDPIKSVAWRIIMKAIQLALTKALYPLRDQCNKDNNQFASPLEMEGQKNGRHFVKDQCNKDNNQFASPLEMESQKNGRHFVKDTEDTVKSVAWRIIMKAIQLAFTKALSSLRDQCNKDNNQFASPLEMEGQKNVRHFVKGFLDALVSKKYGSGYGSKQSKNSRSSHNKKLYQKSDSV